MAYTKNYYHILGLTVPGPGSASPRPKGADLRRAYRNALLATHPDKKGASAAMKDGVYSVDDIKEAYLVLDDAKTSAEYDNWVLRNPHILSANAATGADKHGGGQTLSQDFVLGL